MNSDTPRAPAAGSVLAATQNTSAWTELVMKILEPFSTYWSPSFTAVVSRAATSEPPDGSVTPMAQTVSPVIMGRRYCAFCSGVPWRAMCVDDMSVCTSTLIGIPIARQRQSSSQNTSVIQTSPPLPPYSTGWRMPRNPSSPMRRYSDLGNSAAASHSSTYGTTSLVTKPRTWSRKMS